MFKGVYTALVTPLNKDGSIDESALRGLVDLQIAAGIHGLVPMGTTGESPTVTHQENLRVIEVVIEQAKGLVPVITGTGSNNIQEALEMTIQAAEMGAAASLQVTPYYNKPNQQGIYRHFATIADTVDLPLLIYNIPARTARNVDTDTILRLAKRKNIVGVKEASGDVNQITHILAAAPEGFTLLSGDDSWAMPLMALGCHGVISVVAHIVAKEMLAMFHAMTSGDIAEARRIHHHLLPLCEAMFVETNPIPVKYALARLGLIKENYRPPLFPMSDQSKEDVDQAMREYGFRF